MSKVAVVTGGSRGIGREICLAFARAGYYVVVNYNKNRDAAEQVVEEVESLGVEGMSYQAAVEDFNSCEKMAKKVIDAFGSVDILVNNAGITKDKLFLRMTEEDFKSVIDTNLVGAFNATKVFSRGMLKNRSGAIINISSVVGLTGNAGQANYAASKAGIHGLTKSLAREFAPRNVRVNAVAPGFISTEMTEQLAEDVRKQLLQEIPMGRYGEPEEVARTVLFLARDATYLTGQVLSVNGGMSMC